MESIYDAQLSRSRQVVEQFVGKPWGYEGRGPDAYDCWGLLCAVVPGLPDWRADNNDIISTIRSFSDNEDVSDWEDAPYEDGVIVAMSYGKYFHHAGVWMAGGVLHADKPQVTWDTISDLKRKGWRKFRSARWIGKRACHDALA